LSLVRALVCAIRAPVAAGISRAALAAARLAARLHPARPGRIL
jgi:hypothetical protein